MENAYFNGRFISRNKIAVSPDDRGFLFADGVYEVVCWYGGFFFDMKGHMTRLRRSLRETGIVWEGVEEFPQAAEELIHQNSLGDGCSLVYLQVTRGAARRTHSYPDPPVPPTIYAFARRHSMDTLTWEQGINAALSPDLRWGRCDIKSIALLPNVMAYQAGLDKGCGETIFVRDGIITEASHSNVFFVKNETLYTHPESNCILSGITRKNILSIAAENNIPVIEEAVAADMLSYIHEAFIANTTGEITPVLKIGDTVIGDSQPGEITKRLQRLFRERVSR